MRVRRTSRLILLDPDDRVLLFKVEDQTVFRPDEPALTSYWVTPGGSLEPGESHEDAARRELWEETGIVGIEPGPWVAVSEPLLSWAGERIVAHDRFYLIRAGTIAVTFANMSEQERSVHRGYRWWLVPDFVASGEPLVPPGLKDLLVRLVAGEVPSQPVRLD